MENVNSHNSPTNYLDQIHKEEARINAIIAVVVMLGFVALLAYMFFVHSGGGRSSTSLVR